MNCYNNYYNNLLNSDEKNLLCKADEIISLYMTENQNNRINSLRLTRSYFKELKTYLENHRNNKKFDFDVNSIINVLNGKSAIHSNPIVLEISVASRRIFYCLKGEKVNDFGIDHNARVVDLTLRILKITQKTVFDKLNREYLNSRERFFLPEKENDYLEKVKIFYRNAYRAEMYSHKIYTDTNTKGMLDMYTPLILSRMAVEQFLKFYYEKKLKTQAPSTSSECRINLEKQNLIPKNFSNELWAVIKRGNVNTHEGFANYVFANIHCIQVLKYCLKLMEQS